LSLAEAPAHPHNVARQTFVDVDGVVQPAAAPRFSRTPGAVDRLPTAAGRHTTEVLHECGFGDAEVDALVAAGVVRQAAVGGAA
ncbi:MAG TPA: CoA transferase, partial [Acidimicrobiales bacterium]|nr:CoA transferase [Acidimicrobiales bacterium]